MEFYDVCIIGGGAAGLAAAASLDSGIKVCLLEKNKFPGRKIAATGGGKCNITNEACGNKDLTLDFFAKLGLELYCDDEGRYFPYSNQASDVVETLISALCRKNTNIITEFTVNDVSAINDAFPINDVVAADNTSETNNKKGKFRILGSQQTIAAYKLILAPGGKAAPQLGTTGDGYGFARAFGHEVKKVYPILTGLKCWDFKDIKGVRAKGAISLYKDGELLKSESGEIQFTEDGISGICVFNLTPYIKADEGEKIEEALKRYKLKIDLAPDFTREQMVERKTSFGILSKKLSKAVDIKDIKNWELPIKGVKGWKDAQCTAGGVSLDEIDMDTMESKLVKGLYFAGEIIDYQGPCGGFNLQNAWETGIKAAGAVDCELKALR